MILPLALGVLLPSIESLPISYRVFVCTTICLPIFILKRISQSTLNVANSDFVVVVFFFYLDSCIDGAYRQHRALLVPHSSFFDPFLIMPTSLKDLLSLRRPLFLISPSF